MKFTSSFVVLSTIVNAATLNVTWPNATATGAVNATANSTVAGIGRNQTSTNATSAVPSAQSGASIDVNMAGVTGLFLILGIIITT